MLQLAQVVHAQPRVSPVVVEPEDLQWEEIVAFLLLLSIVAGSIAHALSWRNVWTFRGHVGEFQ